MAGEISCLYPRLPKARDEQQERHGGKHPFAATKLHHSLLPFGNFNQTGDCFGERRVVLAAVSEWIVLEGCGCAQMPSRSLVRLVVPGRLCAVKTGLGGFAESAIHLASSLPAADSDSFAVFSPASLSDEC